MHSPGRRRGAAFKSYWPVEHAAAALPVILGALPAFDRQRRFEGFRGFGVIHVEPVAQAVAAKAVADEPAAPAAPAACQPAPAAADADEAATEAPAAPLASPLGENVVALRPYQALTRAAFAVVKDNALVPAPPMPREGSGAPSARGERRTILERTARLPGDRPRDRLPRRSGGRGRGFAHRLRNGAAVPLIRGDAVISWKPAALPNRRRQAEGAAERVRDEPASHDLSALFDRLPVGLLVSRFGLPVFVNRTLLDWLDHRDAESFLIDGGLAQMFGGEPAATARRGCA